MVSGFGVDLHELSVNFGEFVAVRDATVAIEPGEFFSFLGPSGLWQDDHPEDRFGLS
jgi:spermidine/putrescine transport system ATP-binding protein